MTKQEFIQETALRLIVSHSATPLEITDFAMELADRIYGEEEEEPDVKESSQDSKAISAVVKEVERLEYEERKQMNAELKEKCPDSSYHYTNRGYAKRFSNVCIYNDIDTVQDLLDFGRSRFLDQRNMGRKCIDMVDQALLNLYNIKSW